jgi:hypothetical protein
MTMPISTPELSPRPFQLAVERTMEAPPDVRLSGQASGKPHEEAWPTFS